MASEALVFLPPRFSTSTANVPSFACDRFRRYSSSPELLRLPEPRRGGPTCPSSRANGRASGRYEVHCILRRGMIHENPPARCGFPD